jgi:hypothetical protein
MGRLQQNIGDSHLLTHEQKSLLSQVIGSLEEAENLLFEMQTAIFENDDQPDIYEDAVVKLQLKVTAIKDDAQRIHSDELEEVEKVKLSGPPSEELEKDVSK